MKRINQWNVIFENIWKHDEEPPAVRQIRISLYAENIDEAQTLAWQAVSANPDTYEIIVIEQAGAERRYNGGRF